MEIANYSTNTLKTLIYRTAWEGSLTNLSEAQLNSLYFEAYKRKLYRPDVIHNMHSWALYLAGLGAQPHYRVTPTGGYWRKAA